MTSCTVTGTPGSSLRAIASTVLTAGRAAGWLRCECCLPPGGFLLLLLRLLPAAALLTTSVTPEMQMGSQAVPVTAA